MAERTKSKNKNKKIKKIKIEPHTNNHWNDYWTGKEDSQLEISRQDGIERMTT